MNNRGFTSPSIIFALIVFLVVLGGVYVWETTKTNTSSTPKIFVTPTATVDQNGKTFVSSNPTISGTAYGAGPFVIDVSSKFSAGGGAFNVVSVSNGRWSVTLNPTAFPSNGGLYNSSGTLPNGIYLVAVFQGVTTVPGNKLTIANFTVKNTSANSPSATIDQSSLTQKAAGGDWAPVITGTASKTDRVYVYINGDFNNVPVVNGRWSTLGISKHIFSPGSTYPIEVRGDDLGLLTTGTLTVQ